jgi:hypothetical protein
VRLTSQSFFWPFNRNRWICFLTLSAVFQRVSTVEWSMGGKLVWKNRKPLTWPYGLQHPFEPSWLTSATRCWDCFVCIGRREVSHNGHLLSGYGGRHNPTTVTFFQATLPHQLLPYSKISKPILNSVWQEASDGLDSWGDVRSDTNPLLQYNPWVYFSIQSPLFDAHRATHTHQKPEDHRCTRSSSSSHTLKRDHLGEAPPHHGPRNTALEGGYCV